MARNAASDAALTGAYRLLGGLWLSEVSAADLPALQRLPGLAETLPVDLNPTRNNEAHSSSVGGKHGEDSLLALAVEYQRLFGFNLPPYESLFVDPSGLLDAPATARLRRVYQQAGWAPPAGVRTAAADHLGLEMLAYSSLDSASQPARRLLLLHAHLALWVPVFCLTVQRLQPQPFYLRLSELTLELLLESLSLDPPPAGLVPFPELPPPPVYQGTYQDNPFEAQSQETNNEPAPAGPGLGALVRRLTTPRQAGFYLTRQDIARIGQALQLPGVVGERLHMLHTLFTLAGQYEQVPALVAGLERLLASAQENYRTIAADCPAWGVYARAWSKRIEETRKVVKE